MPIDQDSLMDSIAEYLKPEREYIYLRSEPGEVPRFIGGILDGDHAMWFLKINIEQNERGIHLYVSVSSYIKMPEPRRVKVDELVQQINSSNRDEFEPDTGNPEFELLEDIVGCIGWFELQEDDSNITNFVLMLEKCTTVSEEYFDAVMSVGFGGIDPSLAMEKVRKESSTEKVLH